MSGLLDFRFRPEIDHWSDTSSESWLVRVPISLVWSDPDLSRLLQIITAGVIAMSDDGWQGVIKTKGDIDRGWESFVWMFGIHVLVGGSIVIIQSQTVFKKE